MLVLSRKCGESIRIGTDICITVNRIEGVKVRLAFDAPRHVQIVRTELLERPPDDPPRANEEPAADATEAATSNASPIAAP